MSGIVRALAVGMSSMLIALGIAGSAVAASPDRTHARWMAVETIIDPLDEQCPEIITHPPIGPGDTGPVVRHLHAYSANADLMFPSMASSGRRHAPPF